MSKDPRAYYQMDVGYLDNPKVESLVETHPRAVLLHQACIAYAAQHLTDGLVPLRPAMRRACAEAEDVQALVDNGLLVDNGDGKVIVHDYLKHNRSAEEAKRASDKGRRAAQARFGATGDAPSNASSNAPSMHGALLDAVPDAMPVAMPREREREKETPPTVESRARRARTLPEGWRPSDETAKAIKREVPGIDLTAEHAKFVRPLDRQRQSHEGLGSCLAQLDAPRTPIPRTQRTHHHPHPQHTHSRRNLQQARTLRLGQQLRPMQSRHPSRHHHHRQQRATATQPRSTRATRKESGMTRTEDTSWPLAPHQFTLDEFLATGRARRMRIHNGNPLFQNWLTDPHQPRRAHHDTDTGQAA
jgi:hypothetical protein